MIAGPADPSPADVERLLAALPDWFGIPEANAGYVAAARTLPTYLARDDGGVLGALLVKRHFPASAEVYLLAVAPGRHRQGIGRALVAAAEADLARQGVRILQVKTLGPSRPNEPYARTRAFYAALGFIPVEEFADLWPGNPCLLLAKPLASGDQPA